MGVFTMAIVQSGSAQNLLTDPGFELQTSAPNPNPTGIPGWANFGGAQFSTNYAHSGSWSLYTPDNGGGYSVPGTYQDFAASPGQIFTLSGWVYTPNVLPTLGNDFAIFQLSFFTGAPPNNYAVGADGPAVGVNIGQPAGGGGVPLPQGVWTFASVSATAPAGANSMGAYILDINADANADFYFDDMSLTVTPVPEPATLSLCALGLAGLAGFRLRRKV
jgi:PEP-CTERM motif